MLSICQIPPPPAFVVTAAVACTVSAALLHALASLASMLQQLSMALQALQACCSNRQCPGRCCKRAAAMANALASLASVLPHTGSLNKQDGQFLPNHIIAPVGSAMTNACRKHQMVVQHYFGQGEVLY